MADGWEAYLENEEVARRVLTGLQNPGFMVPVMGRVATLVVSRMKPYPPEPPGSTYRRTQTLGRRWTHRVMQSLFSVSAIIGNNTPYGPLVQGAETQAEIHKGRWQTDEQVLGESADEIVDEAVEGIDDEIRRLGGV